MSTETSDYSDSDDDVQHSVEKDILVTAYLEPGLDTEIGGKRDLVDRVFGDDIDVDLFEEESEEVTDVTVSLDFEGLDPVWDKEKHVTPSMALSGKEKRVIKNAIEEGDLDAEELPDWISVDVDTYTETEFANDVGDALSSALRPIFEDATIDVDGFEWDDPLYWIAKWRRNVDLSGPMVPEDETERQTVYVSANSHDIKRRQVLKQQDEREACDRFESDGKRWSLQVNVDMTASTESEIEAIEHTLAPMVVSELLDRPLIKKTRITDCEKTTTAKGACYNV